MRIHREIAILPFFQFMGKRVFLQGLRRGILVPLMKWPPLRQQIASILLVFFQNRDWLTRCFNGPFPNFPYVHWKHRVRVHLWSLAKKKKDLIWSHLSTTFSIKEVENKYYVSVVSWYRECKTGFVVIVLTLVSPLTNYMIWYLEMSCTW